MVEISNFLPGVILLLIAGFEIALFVFFWRYEKTITIKAYLIFIAGVILWVGANGISMIIGNGDVTFVQKFTYLGGTLITAGFLLFVYCFPYPQSRMVHYLKYLPLISGIIFGAWFFLGNSFFAARSIILEDGIMRTTLISKGLLVWTIFFLIVWVLAIIELIRRFHSAVGNEKRRLYYLLIGVIISLFIGTITDVILPIANVAHYAWLGSGFSIVWLWFSVKAVMV